MDKLSQDSTKALKAGMSYGKWMAMKNPVVIVKKPDGVVRSCPHCGVAFRVRHGWQKYCSPECQVKAKARRKYDREKADKQPIVKTCATCGKEFVAETWRNKYCGDFCRQRAQVEVVRNYQKRKKEVEANTETLGEQVGL